MTESLRRFCRVLTVLGLCLALPVGCVEGGGPGSGGSAAAPASVSVGRGVTIAGPSGFCVDKTASKARPDGAFVLLGSCASLSRSARAAQPAHPAILTASVTQAQTDPAAFAASFPSMARFLTSPAGRAALSRSGKAASLRILQIGSVGEVMYVRATDSAPARGQAVETEYWRALLLAKGQIVTLTVLGLRDKPLASGEKRAILEKFVARVRTANGP